MRVCVPLHMRVSEVEEQAKSQNIDALRTSRGSSKPQDTIVFMMTMWILMTMTMKIIMIIMEHKQENPVIYACVQVSTARMMTHAHVCK